MKTKKVNSQKTVAFRTQMHIGAAIADKLDKRLGLKDTAKVMGMSETMVRRIECQALYKVSARLKGLLSEYINS